MMQDYIFRKLFPDELIGKYVNQPFSHEALIRYIDEFIAYRDKLFPSDGTPPTYSSAYLWLKSYLRGDQVDHIHIVHAALRYHELRRIIDYDPILKQWLHIEKDEPVEMIIKIGP
jgi:hypothetical protein